jgi:hypothetical protein
MYVNGKLVCGITDLYCGKNLVIRLCCYEAVLFSEDVHISGVFVLDIPLLLHHSISK